MLVFKTFECIVATTLRLLSRNLWELEQLLIKFHVIKRTVNINEILRMWTVIHYMHALHFQDIILIHQAEKTL